ncbi:MAG: SDR family oxidoreductase [Pseudomonadota bacterium]
MANHLTGKSVFITGAGGGFGRLIAENAAALGAKVTCADIDGEAASQTATMIANTSGAALAVKVDVTDLSAMKAAVEQAVESQGAVDVMVNNAGVMPLAFFSDHEAAHDKWTRCLDINIKGVLNGITAVYDHMMTKGSGHVINISSIYGNFPVVGAGVYGATKAAVNYLSESLRVETRGKIKVTIVKPTGVPLTGLSAGVVNPEAVVGILGQNTPEFLETMQALEEGEVEKARLDAADIDCRVLDPAHIADQVIHAMNQPPGVSVGDITVRAAGDHYIL